MYATIAVFDWLAGVVVFPLPFGNRQTGSPAQCPVPPHRRHLLLDLISANLARLYSRVKLLLTSFPFNFPFPLFFPSPLAFPKAATAASSSWRASPREAQSIGSSLRAVASHPQLLPRHIPGEHLLLAVCRWQTIQHIGSSIGISHLDRNHSDRNHARRLVLHSSTLRRHSNYPVLQMGFTFIPFPLLTPFGWPT